MRFYLRLTMTSRSFLWLPALLLAFTLTGCDSAPKLDPAEAQRQNAARQEIQTKSEEEINALNKKSTGGKGAVLKNIKSGLKGGTP